MMKIKKGDTVMIRTGANKGKTGKVVAVHPKLQSVTVDGINMFKKHIKPTQTNPQGGISEVHKPIAVSKVGLVHPTKKNQTTRVGFDVSKSGKKVRKYKANDKEVK